MWFEFAGFYKVDHLSDRLLGVAFDMFRFVLHFVARWLPFSAPLANASSDERLNPQFHHGRCWRAIRKVQRRLNARFWLEQTIPSRRLHINAPFFPFLVIRYQNAIVMTRQKLSIVTRQLKISIQRKARACLCAAALTSNLVSSRQSLCLTLDAGDACLHRLCIENIKTKSCFH